MAIELQLPATADTEALGERIARLLEPPLVIWLKGDLGAGKTTLVRGVLRGAGQAGRVRSPTYTLVEPYELPGMRICHLDLYRLADPEELEFLGLRDLLDPETVLLVEWPERGAGVLPAADLTLSLRYEGEGRQVRLEAGSGRGEALLDRLAGLLETAWPRVHRP